MDGNYLTQVSKQTFPYELSGSVSVLPKLLRKTLVSSVSGGSGVGAVGVIWGEFLTKFATDDINGSGRLKTAKFFRNCGFQSDRWYQVP